MMHLLGRKFIRDLFFIGFSYFHCIDFVYVECAFVLSLHIHFVFDFLHQIISNTSYSSEIFDLLDFLYENDCWINHGTWEPFSPGRRGRGSKLGF